MEEDPSHGFSSFWTQANALLRKNLTLQKRNPGTNIRLIAFPLVVCLFLSFIQNLVRTSFNQLERNETHQYGDPCNDGKQCIPQLQRWPPLLQIPQSKYRSVRSRFNSFDDLPDDSCRKIDSCAPEGNESFPTDNCESVTQCPATILVTGDDRSFGEILAQNMLTTYALDPSKIYTSLAINVMGTPVQPPENLLDDFAFSSDYPIYIVRRQCTTNSTFDRVLNNIEIRCVQGLTLWRNTSSEVNEEIYAGYRDGNLEKKINEIIAAYDFLNSDKEYFNVSIWYNSTYNKDKNEFLLRVPRSVNLVSNAYIKSLRGPGTQMIFEFVKEMFPKGKRMVDLSGFSLIVFTWVILQLFPIMSTLLVYEKQQRLRMIMKMHGLGDGPYWLISYAYFLLISLIYMFVYWSIGSFLGFDFFRLNDYGIQFLFYTISLNLQISLAFLLAVSISNVTTVTVLAYTFVFTSGILADNLLKTFIEDKSAPRSWVTLMELYPGFSLYRGLYDFVQFSHTGGMVWSDLRDATNGMREVLSIMFVEWLVVLLVAYSVDQASSITGVRSSWKKRSSSFRRPSLQGEANNDPVSMDKIDINGERKKVERLLFEESTSHAIICRDLKKVYPGRDGNPDTLAVRGLFLALPQRECFGILGPSGAGKTSFISMMTGLIKPTSGTALVQGLDLETHLNEIYPSMGVCPQYDLLWETLTGKEHLLFYGRLKNLKGSALTQAVEESLKSVNLFHGGVAGKQVRKYSGGMKRRLSVAISLIGKPKVVYLDEPSTGLDPPSRHNLWNVLKRAKKDQTIILTTQSMEEADFLCDRIAIFVDGSIQCIGNPKELKARYGGCYVLSITTSSDCEEEVEYLVLDLSPNAKKIYHISGTQKFELPKHEVQIADVFHAVQNAKNRFTVFAWGLADTTLEDVFIKVARRAQPSMELS